MNIRFFKYFILLVMLFMLVPVKASQNEPSLDVNNRLEEIEDRLAIADLINRWCFYRDQRAWDRLGNTFTNDGTISISWFDGLHSDFVSASKGMAKNGKSTLKHLVGVPRVQINGDRALAEVNVTIMVRILTPMSELDTSSYARFYDRLEKKSGEWKIVRRVAIYEKDRIDPVNSSTLPSRLYKGLEQYPKELKFLARSLKSAGIPLSKSIVLDKSPKMDELYRNAEVWLSAGN